jgi:K+-sensing histidine kinase KdpD
MHTRLGPDHLLRQVPEELSNGARGHLRIFFAACIGVGKTHAMLMEARY